MRALIIHHGRRPPGPDEADRPVTGGALRAEAYATALRSAGYEVLTLNRATDEAGGFEDMGDLLARASAMRPDRILCVQPEDAPALRGLGVPLAVDLYAPRLLEAAFEGHIQREARSTLRALSAGDVFFVSNPRQRLFWMGVLSLLGFDLRVDATRLVPLVAPDGPPRRPPSERGDPPLLVGGGAAWAWQDPRPGLRRVLEILDRRGEGQVVWYGGAPLLEGQGGAGWRLVDHPRLVAGGWLGRRAQLEAFSRATLLFDLMAPNPERALAFGFRHADALGCGLPVLTGPDTALTDWLDGGGWAGDDVEAMLSQALDDPEELAARGRAAKAAAARRLAPEVALTPVLEWVESGWRAPRSGSALVEPGALASEAARERALREALGEALAKGEAEVREKRGEILALNAQIQSLTGIVDRLSRALDEVAGFKREAVVVLGGGLEQSRAEARDATRELSILRADLAKKNAELLAAQALGERLENDLRAAHAEIERGRQKGLFRR